VLQIASICEVYELDGSGDRIQDYMDKIPRSLTEIYEQAIKRIPQITGDDYGVTLRIFKCIAYARRPLTLAELGEAIDIEPGQIFWKRPRIDLTGPEGLPRLSKRSSNLIRFNELDNTISLSHHSVRAFLQSCAQSKIAEISQFSCESISADIFWGEICITYLNFADFEKSLTRTSNTRGVAALSQPSKLVSHIMQEGGQVGLLAHALAKQPSGKQPKCYEAETYLRSIMGTTQSSLHDSHFKLREYCSKMWYEHLRNQTPQGSVSVSLFRSLVLTKELPFPFRPWGDKKGVESLPYWNLFSWAVRGPYPSLIQVWQETVGAEVVSKSWEILWSVEGERLLMGACVAGNLAQVSLLLSHRKALSIGCLNTLLCEAARHGHEHVVETLLDAGAQADSATKHGSLGWITPLQSAVSGGHQMVAERLLQAGADVNAKPSISSGRTALQAAAEGGHMAVVEWLLQAGADVNAKPSSDAGRTALQAAAEGGHMAVVERLLQAGADVNANPSISSGRTALQAAAEGGHMAVVERLLQAGADVNAGPSYSRGRTALQAAAEGGHMAVIERLLQAGADVSAKPSLYEGRTALQAAAEGGHMAVVERLLQAGADVNAEPINGGRTALQAAAERGHMAVIERLLQAGADANAKPISDEGRAALHAVLRGTGV